MAGAAPADEVSEFIASGRTGRRNAVPDIREGRQVVPSDLPSDLPDALGKLSCEDPGASTSAAGGSAAAAGGSGGAPAAGAKPSEGAAGPADAK